MRRGSGRITGDFRRTLSPGNFEPRRSRIGVLDWPSGHARLASDFSLASTPAFLQGFGDGRIPFAMDAVARAQGLLRDGEAAGRVSQCPPELQSGALADRANSGLCSGNGAGSVFRRGCQIWQGFDGEGADLRAAIFVSGQSSQPDCEVSALPGVVGEISGARIFPAEGGKIFPAAGFYGFAGVIADCMV